MENKYVPLFYPSPYSTYSLKAKANGLAENERLRRAADDSARRQRIVGSCRADSGNVPSSTSATGVGIEGTVELWTNCFQISVPESLPIRRP